MRRSSNALPKAKVCTKKSSWSLFGGCCLSDSLQLSESWQTITSEKCAQQIDGMHQKLQCLQQALVNRKDPILLHDNAQLHVTQPMLQKLNELGYKILPHPSYSPDLLPTITSSSISTTFCRENPSTTSRRQKKLSKSLLNPEAWIFMPQE